MEPDNSTRVDDGSYSGSRGRSLTGTRAAYLPAKRGVNAFQLTMMIYFFTCGGPFGIEAAVGAAGPLLTLIALSLIPLVWSLPQALLSAELALLIPENGGNVVWVQAAFGDFVGFINAYNNIASSVSSLALLAVIFASYIPYTLSVWEEWMLRLGFILMNLILNFVGLKWMSRISLILLLFVISPFLAEFGVVIAKGKLDIDALSEVPPVHKIQWGVYLSTVIWCYGGFDNMGSLAGEVNGGRKTFIAGILGSFPLVFLNYFFPIFIGYSINTHYQDWVSGYFGPLGYKIGNWLGDWMVAASAVSNFGQFTAGFAPFARVIWALAKAPGSARKMPEVLAWSHRSADGTVTPTAAILFATVLVLLVSAIPYSILVEIFLMVRVVNLICEYAALIRLRYTRPDDPRPFAVPGGKIGVWLLGLPTVALAAFALANADWIVWTAGAVVNAFTLATFGVLRLWQRYHPVDTSGIAYQPVNT